LPCHISVLPTDRPTDRPTERPTGSPLFMMLEKYCVWYSANYNPPDYSVGRHVFLSWILCVLSGGTVNLLILVTMNIIYINSRC